MYPQHDETVSTHAPKIRSKTKSEHELDFYMLEEVNI